MNEIKYITVKNNIDGAKEPFTGIVVHNKTLTKADLVEEMCRESLVANEDDANVVLGALAEAIAETVGEELLRVNVGQVTFEPAISGSVASLDAPLGAENRIYVNMRVAEEVRNALLPLVPVLDRESGEAAAAPRIDSVEDLATGVHAIVGTGRFVVAGKNLFAGSEGEGVKVVSGEGVEIAATVHESEEGSTGERLYCSMPSALPAGLYILAVATRGGAGEDAAVIVVKRKVEVK